MQNRLTDEEFQAIEQKWPGVRLRRVMTPAGEFVLRCPTVGEESAYQTARFGSTQHVGICWRNLLVTITVHPDAAGVQQALKSWPALSINPKVVDAMRILRGEADEEEGKS